MNIVFAGYTEGELCLEPYLEADSTIVQTLNISIQTFGVIGYQNHHRIRIFCVIGY